MNQKELKSEISSMGLYDFFLKNIILLHENICEKYLPELFQQISNFTNFPNDFKFKQKVYHFLNDDKELKLGKCKVCGKQTIFNGLREGYGTYCCKKCSGIGSADKGKETKLKRYGNPNFNNRDKMRETNLEKYGDAGYHNEKKREETCLEKYGKESYIASKEFIDNYNDEEWVKAKEDKRKETCLERYGVDNVANSEQVKNMYTDEDWVFEHFKKKYADFNIVNEIKNKRIETNLEKFGAEYYTQSDEYKKLFEDYEWVENKLNQYKQTNNESPGVDFYTQSEEFKEKFKNYEWVKSIREKVYQTKKKNHSFNISNIEEKFANWLTENNIKFERQYRSEEYPFCCDFYLSDYNLYIEIQGNWTHGKHPFDKDNEEDGRVLEIWKSKKSDYYLNAIDTWTIRDVKKRNIAKENNLKFLEIFSCKLEDCVEMFKKYVAAKQ